MITIDYEKCTGCGACVQCCPQNAINWKPADFGFVYPLVDVEKCTDCKLCELVCPIDKKNELLEEQEAYALKNNDPAILLDSTSGGAFSAIAAEVLDSGGIVYGCSMEAEFQVRHIRISNDKQLYKLRGSKYVQSNTGNTYKAVREDLKKGYLVLYTGTPCQIAGLYGFLSGNIENLITVDLVCHGVGSQEYFNKFVQYLKKKEPGLNSIEFRNKEYVGWSCGGIMTVNERTFPFYNHEHYYYHYFLSGEIYRNSCYNCQYANMNRVGDITLGDFWGAEGLNVDFEVSDGCSLVIVNTEKGKGIIKAINGTVSIKSIDIEVASKNNEQLKSPSRYKGTREKRIKEYITLSGDEIQKLYLKTHMSVLIVGKIKSMLPYRLKSQLKKVRSYGHNSLYNS